MDKTINFSGHLLNTEKFDLTVVEGSKCDVTYKSLPASVQCTVILSMTNGDGTEEKARVTLNSGMTLATTETSVSLTGNYQLILPNLLNKDEPIKVPEEAGLITKELNFADPPAICADNISSLLPNPAAAGVVKNVLDMTGSNACLDLSVVPMPDNKGAKVHLAFLLDVFNPDNTSNQIAKLAIQGANGLGLHMVDTEIDIGLSIVNLIRKKREEAAKSGRLRYLEEDTSAGVITDDGEFLLGSAQPKAEPTNSLSSSAGPIIGSVAGVLIAVMAIMAFIVIRKRRAAAGSSTATRA